MTASKPMTRRWTGRCWWGCLRLLSLALLMLVDLPPQAQAASMPVVEHLRLRVPGATRAAWLEAEQEIWQPWLCRQKGFLGRDIYWDREKEEAVLLIRWSSREDWLGIPSQDVTRTQEKFEARARQALGLAAVGNLPSGGERAAESGGQQDANPFPLVYAGELEPLQAPWLPSD